MTLTLNKKGLMLGAFLLALLIVPEYALAQVETVTTANNNVTTLLNNIIKFLTGPIVRGLAIVGLIIIGIGAMFGFWDIRKAGYWALGLLLIFSAGWIVNQLIPSEESSGGTTSLVKSYESFV